MSIIRQRTQLVHGFTMRLSLILSVLFVLYASTHCDSSNQNNGKDGALTIVESTDDDVEEGI